MLEMLTEALSRIEIGMVCGVMRGGMPIAVHLSHNLGVDMITDTELLSGGLNIGSHRTVLLVDDVVDTGKTFTDILKKSHYTRVITAALYYKPHSVLKPDYYIEETTDWIVFPWELFGEKPNRKRYEHL